MRERRPGCDSLPPRTPSRWLVSGLCIVLLPLILGTGCSGGGSDKKPEDKPPDKGDKTEESFTGYVSKS
jgi:hypothetical protein